MEKYIKVPTPYPVKVAVPVEKIKEVKVPVVKEIKVPVFIPAPQLKSHQQSQQNSLGDNYHGFPNFNFDDSLFAGSKNHENIGKIKKVRITQEQFNSLQDEENYRRNINLKGNRQQQQQQHHHQQNQQRNPNQHHQQGNKQQNHQSHPQNQQNPHHNQQHQQQFGVVTIPKNLINKIPFDTPQPPSGFTHNNNNNSNKQKQNQQQFAQNQNGPGSYTVQHNFPAQTVRPVHDHVTEASTQYETFSAYPNVQYPQQVVTPQNYYQSPQPLNQELIQIHPQQYAYPQQQQQQASEPQYQIQYPSHIQQIPQQFNHQQVSVNQETFQPSFGVPQQQ